jgi:hypothetical protein
MLAFRASTSASSGRACLGNQGWSVHMGRYLTPLAVVVVLAAIVIIVTSGESIAVRYLVGLVSLDVAVRLVLWERGRQDARA